MRVEIAEIGPPQNDERGDADKDAFYHGREILDLVMPIGVIGVGRNRAQPHRQEGADGGRHIDDAFERIGIERDAAGEEIGRVFQRKHDKAYGDAAKREPDDEFHDGKIMRDAVRVGECRYRSPHLEGL